MSAAATEPTRLLSLLGTEWLDLFDAVLFDCDGVIWLGHQIVERAPEVISRLRSSGKRVFFVTNNATKSREMYVERFRSFGIDVSKDEIVSSAWATAAYARQQLPVEQSRKAFVIGEAGLCLELEECGVEWLGGAKFNSVTHTAIEEFDPLQHDVGAVVVGLDRNINYAKITAAQQFLLRGSATTKAQDMLFLASNPDVSFPFSDGVLFPGAGMGVAAVEACSKRTAEVVGKPEAHMLNLLQAKYQLDAARLLMVGDRLDTDIAFGARNGTKTLLVLTGVSKEEEIAHVSHKPTFVAQSIADILPFLPS